MPVPQGFPFPFLLVLPLPVFFFPTPQTPGSGGGDRGTILPLPNGSTKLNGGAGPNLQLASLYVDQFPDKDMSGGLSKKYKFPIYDSIEGALTLGAKDLAVPMTFGLTMNRAGRFTIELTAEDRITGKSATISYPIRVFPLEKLE